MVMQHGEQVVISSYKADAVIELRENHAADAGITQLILESNGSLWHGDARAEVFAGMNYYERPIRGAHALSGLSNESPSICLLLRSAMVGTYEGRWCRLDRLQEVCVNHQEAAIWHGCATELSRYGPTGVSR